jgi:hypothetical protein
MSSTIDTGGRELDRKGRKGIAKYAKEGSSEAAVSVN